MKLYTIKYSNGLYPKRHCGSCMYTTDMNEAIIETNLIWLDSFAKRCLDHDEVKDCEYRIFEVKIVEA